MLNRLLLFIWSCVIIFFSIAPDGYRGQSFLANLAVTDSGFFLHVLGYFIFGSIIFFSIKKRIGLYLLGVFLIGLLLEFVQIFIPTRTFNMYDVLGNGIGVLCVALIVLFSKILLKQNE